jgi:hypothetical protein
MNATVVVEDEEIVSNDEKEEEMVEQVSVAPCEEIIENVAE